jgi:signal transduction histidine kinase
MENEHMSQPASAQKATSSQVDPELRVLNEVLAAVHASQELEAMLVNVAERLCHSLEADECSLYVVEEGDTPLVGVSSRPGHVPALLRPEHLIEGGPLRRRFEDDPSLSHLPLARLTPNELLGLENGPGEGIICSLWGQGELIGLALLRGPQTPARGQAGAFWRALGHQIGLAVQKTRLVAAAQQRAALAQARVQELDAFIYAVSHDLKSPLTKVRGFAEVLAEDYVAVLDEQGRLYLERISANARIMAQMIDEILMLAKLGHDQQSPEQVNLNRVLNAVLLELYPEIKARGVTVRIDSEQLPTVVGQEIWLEQVFANLITNAFKFIGDDHPDPRVEIGWEAHEGGALFWVGDNGVGIASEDQERIFEPFTRLHTLRRDGTGLALTIVRRVVEEANGRIWVESQPGTGSRFYFTWPSLF